MTGGSAPPTKTSQLAACSLHSQGFPRFTRGEGVSPSPLPTRVWPWGQRPEEASQTYEEAIIARSFVQGNTRNRGEAGLPGLHSVGQTPNEPACRRWPWRI